MKDKRRYEIVRLVLLIAIAAYGIRTQWTQEVSLAERYPEVIAGEYDGKLVLSEPGRGEEPWSADVPSEALRDILVNCLVKRGKKSRQTPELAFEIRLTEEEKVYSIIAGADGTISVSDLADLENTRTFWEDTKCDLFSQLYDCCPNNGGAIIPNIPETHS